MKIIFAAAIAASLATAASPAMAENGRNGAVALGAVAGVAVGAVGASMLMNQRRPATIVEEAPEPVVYEQPRCFMRMMDLFDRDGNFVKKDRVRVCR